MHEKFYLNNDLVDKNEINSKFGSGEEIKSYLSNNKVECGYIEECKARLVSAIHHKNKIVYLRSKRKIDHLINCPFHDLVKLKEKIIKNKTLKFLIKKDLPKRTVKVFENRNDELIAAKYNGTYLKLDELFELLRNDPDLEFLKKQSFIDPEYCEEWYAQSHDIKDNAVLLTGVFIRKFYACNLQNSECENSYNCQSNHEPKNYKIEIIENNIEFHISVSEEIYNLIDDKPLTLIEKFESGNRPNNFKDRMYHVLAIINERGDSTLHNKKFYTKNNKHQNHVVKNKRFIEKII